MVTVIPSPSAPDANSDTNPGPVSDRGLLRAALGLAVVAVVLFGLVYPLIGVGVGQLLFNDQANGSLIGNGQRIVGSALVAQPFAGEGYFRPRPSAVEYQPMAAGASNAARTNPALRQRIASARRAVAEREGTALDQVPGDLVTESGAGFDPHISPRSARIQIPRVARARGVDAGVVAELVKAHTEGPQFGLLGQARVNVLALNLALDKASGDRRERGGALSP